MDFTNLKGAPIQPVKYTPEHLKQLRRLFYIAFANTRFLQDLYSDILERFKKNIEKHILTQNNDRDILYYFLKSVKFDHLMEEQARKSINVLVNAQPLLPSINVASEYRLVNQVVSEMQKIGYQHLHVSSIITDSSESDTSSSESDTALENSFQKLNTQGTDHKVIEIDCGPMLELHTNKTTSAGTTPHVDILIFMDSPFCKQLSRYLGLMYMELMLEEAERPFEYILRQLDDPDSKVYRLIGRYINKHLIAGYNNVCLVHHFKLWQNISANVRAVITCNRDAAVYMKVSETSNFEIILEEQPSFLTYVEAISMIIDKALNCKCHVIAKYECGENLYCNVKLSLLSIIPLYILRYFSQCKILEHEFEL